MSYWFITGTARGLGMHLVIKAEAAKHTVEAHNRFSLDQSKDFFKLDGDPIDVLVLNAAVKDPETNTTLTTTAADMAEVYNTNVIGSLRVLQAVEHRLVPGSKVVFISSQAGTSSMTGGITVHGANGSHYIPPTYSLAYRCSKAAGNMLVRCAALDLRPRDITVVAIDPGWIQTAMGGPFANQPVAYAAESIVRTIDLITIADTGRFIAWDGRDLTW